MWDTEKKEKTLCSSSLPRATAFSSWQPHQCSSWRQPSVATKKTFALLSPCTVHSQDDISHGPRYSCWQVRLGRNQAKDTADMPLCVHWAPGGESAYSRHSPQSWCCRTYHTGHREHTAQLAVGISAAPLLHSKSILYGLGPNPAEDAIARRLVTETLLPLGQ